MITFWAFGGKVGVKFYYFYTFSVNLKVFQSQVVVDAFDPRS